MLLFFNKLSALLEINVKWISQNTAVEIGVHFNVSENK